MPRNSVGGPGSYSAICDVCGLKYKAEELSRRWDGAMVCEADFETRHPQEFVRARRDNPKLPFIRPDMDDSVTFAGTISLINAAGDLENTSKYTTREDSSSNSVITATTYLVLGSTTTYSAGNWTWTLPVTNGGIAAEGVAELVAKNKLYRGVISLPASSATATINDMDLGSRWSDTVPQTFSEGDRLLLTIRYGTHT